MAFSNYTELQAAIANWMNRTDLTSEIVDFIALAEADMNLALVDNKMETTATVSITSGLGDLPADCLDVLTVKMPDDTVLRPETDREADKFSSSGTSVGVTIAGSQIRIVPPGDTSYDVTLRYRQKVPALSATNATNWVLDSHPNAYLYGALQHAELFIVRPDRASQFGNLFAGRMKAIIDRNIARMVHAPQMKSSVSGGIG